MVEHWSSRLGEWLGRIRRLRTMMKIDRVYWFCLALCYMTLLTPLPPSQVFGQISTGGTISGTVADATGGLVPEATVTILNEESQVSTKTQSTASGTFAV